MNTKLTLFTVITLTAAATAGGTYYLTNAPEATVETQPNDDSQIQVAVNQDPNKPITIVVKSEITEKPRKPSNVGHVHDLLRPDQYKIVDTH
jgi:hypothetical protein